MECKVGITVAAFVAYMRINRNIVECKATISVVYTFCPSRINRNIVECKVHHLRKTNRDAKSVLIETLWNVKYLYLADRWKPHSVLIETLWNVKQIASSVHP